jgi:hypothetical protein
MESRASCQSGSSFCFPASQTREAVLRFAKEAQEGNDAMSREIRSFDYVNSPYERVRAALTRDAPAVFRAATQAAAGRTHSVASALRVEIAGIQLAKEIEIAVKELKPKTTGASLTRLKLDWKAAKAPGLFPMMKAELALYPLTATETQLDFSGRYEPPLGWLGTAVNAVVGHRIAEASVHRFVGEVAHYLRSEIERESRK